MLYARWLKWWRKETKGRQTKKKQNEQPSRTQKSCGASIGRHGSQRYSRRNREAGTAVPALGAGTLATEQLKTQNFKILLSAQFILNPSNTPHTINTSLNTQLKGGLATAKGEGSRPKLQRNEGSFLGRLEPTKENFKGANWRDLSRKTWRENLGIEAGKT